MASVNVDILRVGTRIDSQMGELKVSKACCSAVVLLRTADHNIIVDPGAMGYGQEVLSRLGATGLTPADIDSVVNTHTHLDHTYNNYLFPKPSSTHRPPSGTLKGVTGWRCIPKSQTRRLAG